MFLIHIANDQAMRDFGARLARVAPARGVIYLTGELGAGKTTLVRGFLQGLGYGGAVKSPTYTLVEHYHIADREFYHLDLYRLADPEELEFLGLRDWLEGEALLLIEWPAMAEGVAPDADLEIVIEYSGSGRDVTLRAVSALGRQMLDRLQGDIKESTC